MSGYYHNNVCAGLSDKQLSHLDEATKYMGCSRSQLVRFAVALFSKQIISAQDKEAFRREVHRLDYRDAAMRADFAANIEEGA